MTAWGGSTTDIVSSYTHKYMYAAARMYRYARNPWHSRLHTDDCETLLCIHVCGIALSLARQPRCAQTCYAHACICRAWHHVRKHLPNKEMRICEHTNIYMSTKFVHMLTW